MIKYESPISNKRWVLVSATQDRTNTRVRIQEFKTKKGIIGILLVEIYSRNEIYYYDLEENKTKLFSVVVEYPLRDRKVVGSIHQGQSHTENGTNYYSVWCPTYKEFE